MNILICRNISKQYINETLFIRVANFRFLPLYHSTQKRKLENTLKHHKA